MSTVDLFLRTYDGDHKWLPYLYRSIEKYATGFRRLVIVQPDGQTPPPLPSFPYALIRCRVFENDYIGQQISKLQAWHYSDADVIMYLDSDCVFSRPVDVSSDPDLYEDGKPVIWTAPWEMVGDARCWHDCTQDILGFDPPAETMRRHPFVFPREHVREVCECIGGEERLSKLDRVSEFNLLGNYAIVMAPERFTVKDVRGPMPAPCVRQFWSWGSLTDEVLAEMKQIGVAE